LREVRDHVKGMRGWAAECGNGDDRICRLVMLRSTEEMEWKFGIGRWEEKWKDG